MEECTAFEESDGNHTPEKPTPVETTEAAPGIWKIRINGDLDAVAFRNIDHAIQELFELGFFKLIVDLKDTRPPDSTGIGTFIAYHDRAKKSAGGIVFLSCPTGIKDRFFRLGLDALFRFAETEEEAVRAPGVGGATSS